MGQATGPPTSTCHYECHWTTFKQWYLNVEDHHHACTTHTFLSAIYSSYESVQCKSHINYTYKDTSVCILLCLQTQLLKSDVSTATKYFHMDWHLSTVPRKLSVSRPCDHCRTHVLFIECMPKTKIYYIYFTYLQVSALHLRQYIFGLLQSIFEG